MKKLFLTLLLFQAINSKAQTELISKLPFKPGEKITYIASYNMKGLMTDLVGIEMEVVNVPDKKKPVYRLKFTANTLSSWDEYVKVRHAYQTYIDVETLKPLITAQDSDVKGFITKGKYTYKHSSGMAQIALTKSDGNSINKEIAIKENSYDVVSLLYLIRAINYDKLTIGKRVSLNLVVLERTLPVYVKYLGKETLKVEGLGAKECYKIALQMDQKFVVKPNVTQAWITTDENRLPVLITTIYKEGNAVVKLKN